MPFSDAEISLARDLQTAGLPWHPAVGHYVYDHTQLIDAPSPFRPGVYFILDLKHFLRRAGTLTALQQRLCWLPQWHQARALARTLGVRDADLQALLLDTDALARGNELITLYRAILSRLRTTTPTTAP